MLKQRTRIGIYREYKISSHVKINASAVTGTVLPSSEIRENESELSLLQPKIRSKINGGAQG
jgi:hypothetical protein